MPLAGRDGFNTTNIKSDGSFQSTRPLRGATVAGGDTKCMAGDFNPRAPCGARRSRMLFPQICLPISIHAPLAGRDMRSVSAFSSCRLFQSTRPLRGATRFTICGLHHHTDFNPRAPCGARRQILERMRTWDNISIHAPREGRDLPMRPSKAVRYISIHAPREGRDEVYGVRWLALEHAFQSTRPARGATETPSTEFPTQSKFQSTRPARGATRTVSTARKSLQTFQSTRPARGATTRFSQPSDSSLHFNPRAPRGARRARYQRRGSLCRHFNPRAPRGARPLFFTACSPILAFQSTRPARGATIRPNFLQRRRIISIHAPREGRDEMKRVRGRY